MSFKITNQDLDQRDFYEGLAELVNQPCEVTTSYNISKIMRRIAKIQDESRVFFKDKVIQEYAKKDEAGKILPKMTPELKDAEGKVTKAAAPIPNSFEICEGRIEDFKKAMADFMAIEHEVDCHKIKLYELTGVKVTPRALAALDTILDTSAKPTLKIATEMPR
jgi:hypothetical protein